MCEAVHTINDVAQGKTPGENQHPYDGPGELAAALDDFDERMVMPPLSYNEVRTRPSLEERLESIISGAALMADSSCTRDERRERIVAECNAVRQALQDLLSEYMNNVSFYIYRYIYIFFFKQYFEAYIIIVNKILLWLNYLSNFFFFFSFFT